LDLLFERITDVEVQQQTMKTQIEKNTQTMQQHTAEQQVMAKQIAEAGLARLTINQMRDTEDTESEVESQSAVSDVLMYFQKGEKGKSTAREDQTQHNHFPKHEMPKVLCPKFTRENPTIWKDKCVDYFLLVGLEPKHWVRMAAVHFDGPAAQWLQVYRRKNINPTWLQFVTAVGDKFGKDDYRKALTDLLELKQTGSVEDYYREFQELQFQLCMHNDGYGNYFLLLNL
jgi:hypothetical protein